MNHKHLINHTRRQALKFHKLETLNRADKDDNGNNDNFDSNGDIDIDDEKLSLYWE